MAKKPGTKKTLKSLFSKSEANLSETVESSGAGGGAEDKKNSTEKKKFKFPGLKIKSKGSGASEKSAPESEQVLSVGKPGGSADNSSDNVSTDTDRSSLYATAPRSKGKELSLSEIDLSKTKRFSTFSLGLRKKKKKEDSILSKSAFGINNSGIEVKQETPSDLPLDQTNMKNMSMSQPELDTTEIFNIPSPPPVAMNKPEFVLPSQSQTPVTVHTQPIKQPSNNNLNITNETPKAPIATIPELKLDDNKVNAGIKETTPNVSTYKKAQTALSKVENAISDFKVPDSGTGNIAVFDNSNLQESNRKLDTSISQPALSKKQLEINTTPAIDPKMAATVADKQLKIDMAPAVDPKMAATVADKQIKMNIASTVDPKMAATTTDKQLKINATADAKMAATVEDKQIKMNIASTVDPKMAATTADKQLKINATADPKMAATIMDNQLKINTTVDPKMAATNSDKPSFASSVFATEPANVDTKITQPATHSTNDKTILNSASTSQRVSQNESNVFETTPLSSKSSKKAVPPENQDLVYGQLYDSLFPENFTQEVVASLLNEPSKMTSQYKSFETMSETVIVKRYDEIHTERNILSAPLSTSSPEKTSDSLSGYSSMSGNISSIKTTYVEEKTTKDAPKAVCIRSVTSYDVTSTNDAKPLNEDGKIAYSEFHSEAKYDSGSLLDSFKPPSSVEKSPAPPMFNYVPSQETNTQITAESKRKVVLVKELVTDEISSKDSGCPSPVMENMSATRSLEMKIDESEVFSITSGQTEGYEGICSPAYLSVGSDDGSAMEIFFSAEEDNADDLFTADDREATVIDTQKDASVLEDLSSNRTIVTREDSNVTVNSEEKLFEFELHRRKEGEVQEWKGNGMGEEREAALQVMKGGNEKKAEFLDTPVLQVKEFEVDPPISEVQGLKEGLGISQIVGSELKDHTLVQEQLPNKYKDNAPTKDGSVSDLGPEILSGSDKWQITPKFIEEAELVLSPNGTGDKSNAREGMLADNPEALSNATELENNRAKLLSGEEAYTVTERAGRSGTQAEQVAVDLSGPSSSSSSTRLQVREVTTERDQLPSQDQLQPKDKPDLSQRSLTSFQTPVAEEKRSDTAAEDLDDNMSSGFSSLSSTSLSLKTNSPAKDDDSTYRFKKLSLVSEHDEPNQDTVDFYKTSSSTTTTTKITSNGTDMDTDYKWRNRFEGVYQFKPFSEPFKTSTDYKITTTSTTSTAATTLPEARDYNNSSSSVSSSAENVSSFSQVLSDRPDETDTGRGRGLAVKWEELSAAPAARERREGEPDGLRSLDSAHSGYSTLQSKLEEAEEEEDDAYYSGVFKATLVDLVPESPEAAGLGLVSPPASPDETDESPSQFDMDSLVDTLRNMGPSLRMRSLSARGPQSSLPSFSLPPIVEDAPSPITAHAASNQTETDGLNGMYVLPPELGLKKTSLRDTRSPLELMKQTLQEQQIGSRPLPTMPLRASAASSIVMRSSTDPPSEDLPSPGHLNGTTGSRLDNSIIFSSFRASSVDQTSENGAKTQRSLFRASSLPDIGHSNDRMSVGTKENGENGTESGGTSRFERFSFLLNSSSSSSSSLTGADDYASRISRAPQLSLSLGSPPSGNSPTILLSPTGSLELNRPFASASTLDSPVRVGPPLLQRSFSGDSGVSVQQGAPVFNSVHAGSRFQNQEMDPERNLMSKYRAFPDAYLTKEKEHGKLNPRPGKMYIFDRPGMCGQRIEIRSDVVDATSFELEETISIRVLRGGWVLYEKPNFKGEKIALDEGEIELTCPFGPLEEELPPNNGQVNGGQTNGEQANEAQTNGEQNGETNEGSTEEKPVRRTVIGSIRRAVRDYSVPEISLFPEENAEGKKVVFRDTSEDARIFGFPIKANSVIINAGLWLVYAQPFFQGVPRVLEVGGYSNPEAWGVQQPYVASLHPLKIGEPRVENMGEPKMVVYEKPYFCGKSRTITASTRDFMTRVDRQQQAFMHNMGSLKVLGGIWVGYEKEGFRGHQYLLEEGDYQDWRVWGGCDSEMRSVRIIRADLSNPLLVMFEQPEEEQDEQEENTFEVTEAIPDVELFGYKTSTRSIQVLSGAWVAYSHVDFSGSQYILEKGFYNNCADWGSQDNRICSIQPILSVPRDNTQNRNQILLYNEPDFQGQCYAIDRNNEALSDKVLPKSCRVVGGSWVLYENKQFAGNLYVLSEGDYPNLTSMGCPASCYLRSIKAVPMTLSVPSISLFGLECLEGREITTEAEIFSLVEEGYNNHILSVRVNSGSWVICEHSNYRGRQFLLEPIEITNWPKFSSLQTIGSMYPVRQKRCLFHIKNKERGHFLSIQGGVEEMKSGRVVVTPEAEPMSDIWYYQDGLIKNKLSPTMCLQVMGKIEPAAKVVLWTETRQPIQTWTAQMRGLITSLTFPGMVLDVKGGKAYDKDHVVIMPEDEDRPSQQWEVELL